VIWVLNGAGEPEGWETRESRSVSIVATGRRGKIFQSRRALLGASSAHLWHWCSGKRWGRDEKDRVMVGADGNWWRSQSKFNGTESFDEDHWAATSRDKSKSGREDEPCSCALVSAGTLPDWAGLRLRARDFGRSAVCRKGT
jgi:hypothetical protein